MLRKAVEHIRHKVRSAGSLLVVRGGRLVCEEYFRDLGGDDLHQMACVTKGFVSALVGIAIARGLIGSVEDRLLGYFPEVDRAGLDPQTAGITLKHLLTNTPGWYWPHGRHDHEPIFGRMWRSRDPVECLLKLPVRHRPGTTFTYNGGCAWLLAAILDRAAPGGALAFAERALFEPIGIRRKHWARDPRGLHLLPWGLKLRPRDMARFGYLFLNGGRWADRQVVPAEWVAESVRRHAGAYGYLWWVASADGHPIYAAKGGWGSLIAVAPDLDLIAVITCRAKVRYVGTQCVVDEMIVPAVRAHVPERTP